MTERDCAARLHSNPNVEILNSKQTRMLQIPMTQTRFAKKTYIAGVDCDWLVSNIWHLRFGFVSSFVFRISHLVFALSQNRTRSFSTGSSE